MIFILTFSVYGSCSMNDIVQKEPCITGMVKTFLWKAKQGNTGYLWRLKIRTAWPISTSAMQWWYIMTGLWRRPIPCRSGKFMPLPWRHLLTGYQKNWKTGSHGYGKRNVILWRGRESSIVARCGMMDGEITASVTASEIPVMDDQSNFGTWYGYQNGAGEGTIELYINGKWWVFEAMTQEP